MLVKITQELIDQDDLNGAKLRCRTCPVALAIKPLLKEDLEPSVIGPVFYIYQGVRQVATVELPSEVREFIKAVDTRKSVKPFDFEIEVPSEYRR